MTRRRVAYALAVLCVVVALLAAAWVRWWPTNIDRRALDDFGAPVPGATQVGHDYVSEGNLLCLDSCTRLTRVYRMPVGTRYDDVVRSVAAATTRSGYSVPHTIDCRVHDPARSTFLCTVSGTRGGDDLLVWIYGHGRAALRGTSYAGEALRSPPPGSAPVDQVQVGIAHTG